MDGSKEEYVVKDRQKAKGRQKLLVLISIVSFFGSTVMAVIPAIQQEFVQQDSTLQAQEAESTLKQQEEGFELVLQREPNNQVALDGLLKVRLQLNDIPGAIEPLEKLVKLNPQREDYKKGLENLKKEASKDIEQETTK
ncbi:MAG: tetratricopeptide repeat protein [Cyanobacteria bacterium P01_D01_bin.50]